MSPHAHIRGNVEAGVLSLTLSIVLYLVGRFLGVLFAVLESVVPPAVSPVTLHTLVIPAVGLAIDAGIAVLGLLGLYLIRNGRWSLPTGGPAKLNLATMAFIVGAGAVALRTILNLAAGFTVLPDLRLERAVLDLVISLGLGLFLFWVLDAADLLGPQVVGVVALVLGAVGTAVLGFARYLPRRVNGFDITGGQGAFLVLLAALLWLAAYVWGLGTLRAQRLGRGATAPAAQGTNR